MARNGDEQNSVNRYLWVAGAVGTGACVAYWALVRKEDRWARTKRQARELAKATRKELEPLMRSAGDGAEQGVRFMKESLSTGSKRVAEVAPDVKRSTVEFLDALSDLW